MLGAHYKFVVVNSQGSSVTATVKAKRRKFASDGSLTIEASPTTEINALTVTSLGNQQSSTNDNTTNKYLFCEVEFTVVATTTGTVAVYLARSVDGGTTFPDAGKGQLVGAIDFTASGTQKRVFNVE